MFFLFSKGVTSKVMALFIFSVAAGTDFLDGFLAKRRNEISDFGKFMDPIADKILVLSAFLAFVEMKLIPAWIVVIILLRELIITGLRILALRKGEVVGAEMAGKQKTISQIASIYIVLFFIIFRECGTTVFGFWNQNAERISRDIIYSMMLLTAFFTIISGLAYLKKYRGLLGGIDKTTKKS